MAWRTVVNLKIQEFLIPLVPRTPSDPDEPTMRLVEKLTVTVQVAGTPPTKFASDFDHPVILRDGQHIFLQAVLFISGEINPAIPAIADPNDEIFRLKEALRKIRNAGMLNPLKASIEEFNAHQKATYEIANEALRGSER